MQSPTATYYEGGVYGEIGASFKAVSPSRLPTRKTEGGARSKKGEPQLIAGIDGSLQTSTILGRRISGPHKTWYLRINSGIAGHMGTLIGSMQGQANGDTVIAYTTENGKPAEIKVVGASAAGGEVVFSPLDSLQTVARKLGGGPIAQTATQAALKQVSRRSPVRSKKAKLGRAIEAQVTLDLRNEENLHAAAGFLDIFKGRASVTDLGDRTSAFAYRLDRHGRFDVKLMDTTTTTTNKGAEAAFIAKLGGNYQHKRESRTLTSAWSRIHGGPLKTARRLRRVGTLEVVQYPTENFTDAERAVLAPHFTNLDKPVFGLVNLPETVKGAMFARYSRYSGTLRRLFLDEFAGSLPPSGSWDGSEGKRASELYERIFVGYGDDSVAQLGGAHIACEWVSNVLTKILQRPRLAAYLEQSTRYIAYDTPMPSGDYRYYRDSNLGPEYVAAMDSLFATYSECMPIVREWVGQQFPRESGDSEAAHRRAINAKSFDLLRGLLPAASLSHMGMYATGQTYEQLILHLFAHPLPEARQCGEQILHTVKAVMPSFVARVERPERGGQWTSYLQQRRTAGERWAERLNIRSDAQEESPQASVRLLHVDGDETQALSALLFEESRASEAVTYEKVSQLSTQERATLLSDLVGERQNRRHRPGRGLETLRYRFEVVSDYGAFRDLQRHRLLTVQWQDLTPELGADMPHELVSAGVSDIYSAALERSRAEYGRLVEIGEQASAPYALCLAYRIRYILDLNAREAMHLIELRSGREGHPSYRAVAHAMHALIAQHHPAIAATMTHIDNTAEPRLERMLSEMRNETRAAVRG